jgi:hypothetical protein
MRFCHSLAVASLAAAGLPLASAAAADPGAGGVAGMAPAAVVLVQGWQGQQGQPQQGQGQQPQPRQQSAAGRQNEAQFRAMLWRYAMPHMLGGGGIFHGPLQSWRNSPSSSSSSACSQYSDPGARRACQNGAHWDANALQGGYFREGARQRWGN